MTHAADLVGLLEQNADLEQQLVRHYDEAVRFCRLLNDQNNAAFFQYLLEEEQHHMQDLKTWLKELGGRRSRGYGRYGNRRRGALQDRASF